MILRLSILFIRIVALLKATLGHYVTRYYNRLWYAIDPERPLRPGDVNMSKKWLQNVMRSHTLIDLSTNIVDVVIEDLKGNRGLCSAINVVKIVYNNEKANKIAPTSLIIKTNTSDTIAARYRNAALRHSREAKFYEVFGNSIKNTPKTYYTYTSSLSGSFIILMENAKLNGTDANFYFGNQIWGMPKPLDNPVDPVVVLENIFTSAAKMHAKYWNEETLKKTKWLRTVRWYLGDDEAGWSLGLKGAYDIWKKVKKSKIPLNTINWSKKLIDVIDKSFEHSTWDKFQSELKEPQRPFTLTHADFHAANMINTNSNLIVWLDWSDVCIWEPMCDIGQIMISDVKPELRRAHEKQLIRVYWETLIQHGVSASEYSFDKCWKSYQSSPIERWIWMFSLLSGFDLPPIAIQYFHDQLLFFIEDHSDKPFYIIKPVSILG